MKKILLWLNIALVFVSLGAYVSPFVSPSEYWVFSILGLFYPWILLANILCAVLWVAFRKWYFLFSLVWIIMGWGHFTGIVGINGQNGTAKSDDQLNVMTYNCRGFSKDAKAKLKWTEEELISFIKTYQPDVIAFQEFPLGNISKKYTAILQDKTKLKYHFHNKKGQLALFSIYPIDEKKIHYFGNKSNGYLYADIKKGEQTFRFFNIHLQSNVVTRIAEKVKSEGNLQEKETWISIKGMIGKYRRSTAVRAKQAKEIKNDIKKSPHPVIICGDFNDVPQSNAYHILVKNKQDAFKKAGSGLGTTYAGSIPGLRIDYILSSKQIEVASHKVIKNSYSDHYPVTTCFFLTNK